MYILVKTEERNLQDIVITISIRKDQSAPGVFGLHWTNYENDVSSRGNLKLM